MIRGFIPPLNQGSEQRDRRVAKRMTAKSSVKITERQVGKVSILDMEGDIRIGGSRIALRDAIRSLVTQGQTQVLVNLARVERIDSCGLGELVSSFVTLTNGGGKIKLLNLSQRVREVMTITKLLTVFDVFENEQKAIESFDLGV
ncbi:MAG: anti-sigma factor antagonist [Blastocatellia bacterium]|jgi:anti-sigma B factor antagonist|nr:anti-sigma factor antagonist [Blastocatellia bacterium]